jgi:hypothetical protein
VTATTTATATAGNGNGSSSGTAMAAAMGSLAERVEEHTVESGDVDGV